MVEEAFGYVIFGVVIVGVLVALVAAFLSSDAYDEIGRGGLFEEEQRRPQAPGASAAVRDDEIRQMLEARNARRARRGEEPLDVERELAALTRQPTIDKALLAEIRDLVEARNARRLRRGQEPLDVEAEVDRQLRELQG